MQTNEPLDYTKKEAASLNTSIEQDKSANRPRPPTIVQVTTPGEATKVRADSNATLYTMPTITVGRNNDTNLHSPDTLSINSPAPFNQTEMSELKMRAKYNEIDFEERDSVKVLCGEHDMRTNPCFRVT